MKKENTAFRLSQVTKRLDHMVPDPEINVALNAKASKNLLELSNRLQELLPDPSLSPDERLERFARVVQDRVPLLGHLQPANTKLYKLSNRLNDLVPGKGNPIDKVNTLVDTLTKLCKKNGINVTDEGKAVVKKLEALGDPRAGFAPIRNTK